MSELLPFASDHHPVWSPLAEAIHKAVWERFGLEKVQEFVRQWAADLNRRQEAFALNREPQEQVHEDWSKARQSILNRAVAERFAGQLDIPMTPLEQFCETCLKTLPLPPHPELPSVPLDLPIPEWPLPPSHRVRSMAEKWAVLAAIHDVYWMDGTEINPWPRPVKPADDSDSEANKRWFEAEKKWSGAGLVFWLLLDDAHRLHEASKPVFEQWLKDVAEKITPTAPGENHGQKDEAPRQYLTSWRDILIALGKKDNKEDQRQVKALNKKYSGPIITPKQGAQPKVDKAKLLTWWGGLEQQFQESQQRRNDAEATVAAQHPYARGGTVVPDIAGGVKKRRDSTG